jgi:hypothetical protein
MRTHLLYVLLPIYVSYNDAHSTAHEDEVLQQSVGWDVNLKTEETVTLTCDIV